MSLNRLWAALAVDTCVARGADHFFLAPGSRCTPLTLAAAQHAGAQTTQHFDERGLAFAALGFARASGKPAVFICTSGTAVANAFPAVVEAYSDRVPMLFLTADRPPELRDAGANQTIDQQKILGQYVRWYFDMPCPTSEIDPSFVRSQFDFAIHQSATGPVHINCMFREPFGMSDEPLDLSAYPLRETAVTRRAEPHEIVVRGGDALVVVGGCQREEACAAADLATRHGIPLLGDVTSGLRTFCYDLALAHFSAPRAARLPSPTTVVHVGGRIVSKSWLRFIEQNPPEHLIHITNTDQRIDPTHTQAERIVGPIAATCRAMKLAQPASAEFRAAWHTADKRCRDIVTEVLSRASQLSEPAIACVLSERTPSHHGLFLGNSMPIRDMDRYGFWPAERNITVGANRGASGIDGLVASAVGFAKGIQMPTTLFIGDLSSLHDLNSLALLAQARPPVIIVIVNNHGGGIFDLLPVARQSEHFERYFATPHDFVFEGAAEMFHLTYQRPRDLDAFRTAYELAIDRQSSTIIELITSRETNQRLRRRISVLACPSLPVSS